MFLTCVPNMIHICPNIDITNLLFLISFELLMNPEVLSASDTSKW